MSYSTHYHAADELEIIDMDAPDPVGQAWYTPPPQQGTLWPEDAPEWVEDALELAGEYDAEVVDVRPAKPLGMTRLEAFSEALWKVMGFGATWVAYGLSFVMYGAWVIGIAQDVARWVYGG